jgi:hypothetical protein
VVRNFQNSPSHQSSIDGDRYPIQDMEMGVQDVISSDSNRENSEGEEAEDEIEQGSDDEPRPAGEEVAFRTIVPAGGIASIDSDT